MCVHAVEDSLKLRGVMQRPVRGSLALMDLDHQNAQLARWVPVHVCT
jgi:hypothetical protein